MTKKIVYPRFMSHVPCIMDQGTMNKG